MSGWATALQCLQAGDALGARASLLADPVTHAEQDFLLGVCAHALHDIPLALEHFSRSLQRDPGHAQAAAALGALLAGSGRHPEAEQVFRHSLAHKDDAQVRFNLAVTLEDTGRLDDALSEYSRLLDTQPDAYAPRHNRAGLHARRMQLADAAADYRELIRHHPDKTLPWQNLADIETSQGHYTAALQRLAEVVRREPGNAKAILSQAIAAAANGDFTDSDRYFEQLRDLDPTLWQSALARINGRCGKANRPDPRLIFLVRQHEHLAACDWSRWPLYGRVFRDVVAQPAQGERISLMFRAQACPLDASEQMQLAMAVAHQFPAVARIHPPSPAPMKLRIGYLASSFGDHVMGLILRHFYAAHDPHTTEILILSLAPFDGSKPATTIRATPQLQWMDLSDLDDETVAHRIDALQLDVLVDLAGYSDAPRPGILARRPAPVQVAWLATAYTSGAPWLDYVITDAQVSPGPDGYSEAEVRLPECYFVFSHDPEPPVTPPRNCLGLPDQRFVFACLNAPWKIDPDTFGVWMRILHAAPDSVLWLLGDSTATVLNLKREAEWRGIDPRRLLFAPRTTPEAHLARLGAADLFLDTRYCNGHATVAESLWSGLPVLTCPGSTCASRVASSLLHSCDLPELVVPDWAAYEREAIALVHDTDRLQTLRARLATTRLHAAPFAPHKQALHLEKAYRHMRERFARGLPPAPFAVADLD